VSSKYELTGYDRNTGRFVKFYDVPDQTVAVLRKIASIPASDDGLGSYPLDTHQVAAIAKVLKTPIEPEDLDYFLEAYDGDAQRPATG
jgi:hypothetical protein